MDPAASYEEEVELTGRVCQADLESRDFALRLENGQRVPGKFEREQESVITEAMRDHQVLRVHVRGIARYTRGTTSIERLVKVIQIVSLAIDEMPRAHEAELFWMMLERLSEDIPASELEKLPPDAAINLDYYLDNAE